MPVPPFAVFVNALLALAVPTETDLYKISLEKNQVFLKQNLWDKNGEADTGIASTGLPSQGHCLAGEVRESAYRDSAEPEDNHDNNNSPKNKTESYEISPIRPFFPARISLPDIFPKRLPRDP